MAAPPQSVSASADFTATEATAVGTAHVGSPSLAPPVVDIGPLVNAEQHSDAERDEVLRQIGSACETWGFFHVTSHGVSQQLQEEVLQQMQEFFQKSDANVRESVRRTATNSRGYADNELTKQQRDVKQIFDVGGLARHPDLPEEHPDNHVLDGYNQWPSEASLPAFRSTAERYFKACEALSALLVGAIADSWKQPGAKETILACFQKHSSFLRYNYYPVEEEQEALPGGGKRLGVSRHTDAGGLTIIMQDATAALEVYSGSRQDNGDGAWTPVNPIPGALTINTGDMLTVWSNGRFKAPEHRVRAMKNVARCSAPFFYNPDYSAVVAPILTVAEGEGAVGMSGLYRPIVWGEFRQRRFAGDYSNVGKEIQIEDFRITGK